MGAQTSGPDVVYVEREEGTASALGWFLLGGVVGAGIALLFAPRTGEETRRDLGVRALRLKELTQDRLAAFAGEDEAADDEALGSGASGAWEEEEWEDEEGEDEDEEEQEEEEEQEDEDVVELRSRGDRGAKVSAARRELERRLARSRAQRAATAEAAGALADADEDEEPVA